MNIQEFYKKYCLLCGSQRCEREGEWLEGCSHYKEECENDLRRPEERVSEVN